MKRKILSVLLVFCLSFCLCVPILSTTALSASIAQYELCWPLLTTTSGYKTITSSLGNRTAPIEGATVSHKGIDIGVKTGSVVLSAADGKVCFVGYNNARGNYVVIYHESLALTSVYQHLSSYIVTAGQTVNKGQEIARSGSTGIVTGPHLHFELVVTPFAPASVDCAWVSNAQLLDGHYNNSLISYEWRDTASDSTPNLTSYFVCNVRINCVNGQTVNLYSNPEDTSRADYFSKGQSANSTCGVVGADGSIWYQIIANQNGVPKIFWLKYESWKMTVTNLMPTGPYTLTPKCAPGTRLDVNGASKNDGANVQIYTSNSTAAQQWELTYLGNGYYTITSKASGKALDVAGASTKSGANVQQYTSNGTNAQQWMLKDAGDGYYYIVPRVNTALCLDVAGAGTADKTNVGTYTANGTDAQKWKLTAATVDDSAPISDGLYTLTPKCAIGMRLDVNGGYTQDGVNIQIYTANETAAQQWRFAYLGDGYYRITAEVSGKVLDIANGSTSSGANVRQSTSNGSSTQQWIVKSAGDGYYYISPRANTNLCLDVAGAGTTNKTNVQVYTSNGTNAQRWKFTFVSP